MPADPQQGEIDKLTKALEAEVRARKEVEAERGELQDEKKRLTEQVGPRPFSRLLTGR